MPDVKYKWFPGVRRYRGTDGRFVSERTITHHIDVMTSEYSLYLKQKAEDLIADFTPDKFYEFAATARRDLESLHNSVTIIALGGLAAALKFVIRDEPVWTAAQRTVADQVSYFDRFMYGVLAGAVALSALAARAAMYPLAAFGTYENAKRAREMNAAGFNEEQRVLQSGNPCITCQAQAALGWQPLGTLRRIGDSECIVRCRCYFRYRTRED